VKKIAVMTSGGDAAGMNAALRAVVRRAWASDVSVVGVQRGFIGLVEHAYEPFDPASVSGILHRGGTILRTFRCPAFLERKTRDAAAHGFAAQNVDGMVIIGGDGSFRGAACIEREWNVPVVGVPATIDNDIVGSDFSIGFDTALNIAVEAVDKIRDTATSHGRIFVIEVMGRRSGMLAMAAGICCGAEEVLVPERPTDLDEMCHRIDAGYDRGKQHAIIIVAEGAAKAPEIAEEIKHRLSREVRVAVLGHIQRGGTPSAFDRLLASRLGFAAVDALLAGASGCMLGWVAGAVCQVPFGAPPSTPEVLGEYRKLQETLR
jgi:6-phosphofructokinase 1